MKPSDSNYVLLIEKELSSGPFAKAQDSFKQHNDEKETDEKKLIVIKNKEIESHVVDALRLAKSINDNSPITPTAALLAVISAETDTRSESLAFRHISTLLKGLENRKIHDKSPAMVNRFDISGDFGAVLMYIYNDIKRTDNRSSIWGRDFVTSIILCTGDKELNEIVYNSGISLAELQDRWYFFVNSYYSNNYKRNHISWWKEFSVPLPGERRTRAGYLAETVKGEDKLGIEKEAVSLAEIIADENTAPPLSIGLIGDWGSGKSFFIKSIQNQVELLNNTPGYCKNIASIEFNAWHVSDANLWASVVDHIFSGIWKKCCKKEDIENARATIDKELREAKGALFESEKHFENVKKSLEKAQKEHEKLNKDYAIEKYIKDTVPRELVKTIAAETGWEKPLKSINDLWEILSQLKITSQRTKAIFKLALKGKVLRSAFIWVLLIAIAASLAFIAGNKLNIPVVKEMVQLLSIIGAVMGSIISSVLAPLNKANTMLTKFTKSIEDAIEEAKGIEGADLNKIKEEFNAIERRITLLQNKKSELEEKKMTLDPFRRLVSFIEGRAESETYRSKQGIISLIRRDFEKLSELMGDWKKNRGNPPEGIEPVDRIIIYVDDLDRCSPSIVVQTLEAIHLLLALDLFIVIVGVDSRWLARSLDVYYSSLLSSQEDEDSDYRISTPQNYLEKIFQVIYAISPMEEQGFHSYIDYLTSFKALNPDEKDVKSAYTQEDPGNKTVISDEKVSDTTGEIRNESVNGRSPSGKNDTPKNNDETAINEINPSTQISKIRGLSLSLNEKDYLKKLFPLIQTPRITKKIVNVYRIIKAKIPLNDLDDLEKEDGRHRSILMLLSILFNYPHSAITVFRNLAEKTIQKKPSNLTLCSGIEKLAEITRTCDQSTPEGTTDVKSLAQKVNYHLDDKREKNIKNAERLMELSRIIKSIDPKLTLSACEEEALEVSRYSLATGQVWHTWHIPKEILK